MPHPETPELPAPALFDVTTLTTEPVDSALARIPLEELELALAPRRSAPTSASATTCAPG